MNDVANKCHTVDEQPNGKVKSDLELRHLRYIVTSARNGSFSAAAHELNVRQPIVSKRVKEVEDEFGVCLFDRSRAGASLTTAGEAFVVIARRIIEDAERLGEQTKASGSGRIGRIVVGFYMSLSTGSLRAALRDFRLSCRDIDVEPFEAPYTELIAGLHAGQIDVAILLGDAGKCTVFNSLALKSEHLVIALPKSHRLTERPIVYWPELKGERFLISHQDPGPDIRIILERYLAAPSDHPKVLMRHLSRESILSEVGNGEGISLQCETAAGLTDLGIVFKPVHDGNGATRLSYMACWKPSNTNPVVTAFLDAIKPKF